jgi:hypothetical protein
MSGNDFDNKSECCPGGDCGCSTGSNSGKDRFWRLIISVTIILLAVAVTAYSLFYKTPDPNACCPSTGGICAVPGDTILTVESLNSRMGSLELSLIIVTDENAEYAEDLKKMILTRMGKISEMNIIADTIIIRPTDPVYTAAVSQFELTELPAVIAMTEIDNAVLNGGNITSDALADACSELLRVLQNTELTPEN